MNHVLQTSSSGVTLYRETTHGSILTVATIPSIACAPAAALLGSQAYLAVRDGRSERVRVSDDQARRLQLYALIAMREADTEDLPRIARLAAGLENPGFWLQRAGGPAGQQILAQLRMLME